MYKPLYSTIDGEVECIVKGDSFIPICEANTDYQAFLKWNAGKPDKPDKFSDYRPDDVAPLDLDSTIPVVKPEPARGLAKEIDELKKLLKNKKVI